MDYRPGNFRHLPEVVKNLLIINGLFFLATITLDGMGFDMYRFFGLHQFQSIEFMPHQLITHLFMHGNFTHLFFNMFALWMFGKVLAKSFAIKKGKSLEREEMKVLVSNLFACNFPSICPNGNPTIINLAFNDITKYF